MNVTGSTSFISPIATTPGVQSAQVNQVSDPDGDGDGGKRVHKSKAGGPMQQALMQALQSLGLSMPQSANGTPASNQPSGSTDSDGDADGSTAAANGIKHDMRQFMHALFQSVKSETAAAASTAGSSSTDPKTNFAAGLSALISQVSNGSAPADLQSAFAKLAADLQAANPPSTTVGATTATTPATNATTPQATLQALLTTLQQDLGYGSSGASAVGNSISAQV